MRWILKLCVCDSIYVIDAARLCAVHGEDHEEIADRADGESI